MVLFGANCSGWGHDGGQEGTTSKPVTDYQAKPKTKKKQTKPNNTKKTNKKNKQTNKKSTEIPKGKIEKPPKRTKMMVDR